MNLLALLGKPLYTVKTAPKWAPLRTNDIKIVKTPLKSKLAAQSLYPSPTQNAFEHARLVGAAGPLLRGLVLGRPGLLIGFRPTRVVKEQRF